MGLDHDLAAGSPLGRVLDGFRQRFGTRPQGLYRAPGRVNLIGEHTDYNDGFVLPMAIDRAVWVAAGRSSEAYALQDGLVEVEDVPAGQPDRQVRAVALSLGREAHFSLDELAPEPKQRWSNYVRGVLAGFERHTRATGQAPLGGLDLVYAGNVPIGAGLSSSAAVEVAVATAVRHLFCLDLPDLALARLCQRAEHEFAGTHCGLMDQFISVFGREGHALLIDCRSFAWQPVPLPPGQAVVICDTGQRRGLVDSAYNERRAQCEEAARRLGVASLRDVDRQTFEARAGALPALLRRRARHVVEENWRTQQAASALRQGDLAAAGHLMNQSHTSLRDLYEVSSKALDLMAGLARAQPGCWGARMTGAGFGGCVVALVEEVAVDDFVQAVALAYERQARCTPALYVTCPAPGAGPLPLDSPES
jgi:galactokinase